MKVSPKLDCVVGVDFDNTLVSYDELIQKVAQDHGLVPSGAGKTKRELRDKIRALDGGESKWQRVQAVVYGARIAEAKLVDGTRRFFETCRRRNVPAYIISHKTEYASRDEVGINLREAAMAWMEGQRFFEEDGVGLSRENVFFESTRSQKIQRIRHLGCTHFIDDLEETFLEPGFPADICKILYAPQATPGALPGVAVARTWTEISGFIFHASS